MWTVILSQQIAFQLCSIQIASCHQFKHIKSISHELWQYYSVSAGEECRQGVERMLGNKTRALNIHGIHWTGPWQKVEQRKGSYTLQLAAYGTRRLSVNQGPKWCPSHTPFLQNQPWGKILAPWWSVGVLSLISLEPGFHSLFQEPLCRWCASRLQTTAKGILHGPRKLTLHFVLPLEQPKSTLMGQRI